MAEQYPPPVPPVRTAVSTPSTPPPRDDNLLKYNVLSKLGKQIIFKKLTQFLQIFASCIRRGVKSEWWFLVGRKAPTRATVNTFQTQMAFSSNCWPERSNTATVERNVKTSSRNVEHGRAACLFHLWSWKALWILSSVFVAFSEGRYFLEIKDNSRSQGQPDIRSSWAKINRLIFLDRQGFWLIR